MFPRQLEANGRQWSHPGEDSRTRRLTNTGSQRNSAHVQSILLQHQLCQYDLQRYSVYNITMISIFQHLSRHSDLSLQHILRTKTSIVTASSPSLWSPLLQHLPRHYDPYNYNTYYVAMTSIATASTMALWSLFVTAYTTPLWSLLLQHLLRQFDLSLQHLLRHYDFYCSGNYCPYGPY